MESPSEPTPFLILYHHTQNGTTVLVRQYLTVDSSIRQDKSDSNSTVPTTCYLPDFFILRKPCRRISLYTRSYGSVNCRSFSCQAGGRGFESLRSRSLKPRFLIDISGFFVSLLCFPDMTVNDTNRPFLK